MERSEIRGGPPSFPGCASLHPGYRVLWSVAAAAMEPRRRGNGGGAWGGDGATPSSSSGLTGRSSNHRRRRPIRKPRRLLDAPDEPGHDEGGYRSP